METILDIEKSKMKEIAVTLKTNSDLPDFRKSCFCLPVRGTLLAWGYLKLGVVFVFGILVMNVISLSFMMSSSSGSMIQLILILIYLGSELVLTNALIVGIHTQNRKILRVYLIFLSVNIAFFVGLLVIPLTGILDDLKYHLFNAVLTFICAAFVYLGLNVYVMVLVRSEIHRLHGDISYEKLNEETVITGVTPPNSENYFLVAKLNPNSTSGPPTFLVKKLGKVTLNPS